MGLAPFNRVRESWVWLLAPPVVGFITPSLVISTLQVLVGGLTPYAAIQDIAGRQFAPGHNLFLLALWGLIPFLVLSVLLLVLPAGVPRSRIACLSIFGLLGILGLMVPIHWEVWAPLYYGGHMSSTAVIVFIPLPFGCFMTMLSGLAIGWLVSKLPWFTAVVPSSACRGEPVDAADRPREKR
jgi:hypothetical protein